MVTKYDLLNGLAIQTFPDTGPTGDPRISVAKIYVRSSLIMQSCLMSAYQNRSILFTSSVLDQQKSVRTTQRTKWVVHWATQDFLLVAALYNGADSRFVPSQWETALLCNGVSHWLGENLESALVQRYQHPLNDYCQTSNIRRIKSQNMNASRLILQLF